MREREREREGKLTSWFEKEENVWDWESEIWMQKKGRYVLESDSRPWTSGWRMKTVSQKTRGAHALRFRALPTNLTEQMMIPMRVFLLTTLVVLGTWYCDKCYCNIRTKKDERKANGKNQTVLTVWEIIDKMMESQQQLSSSSSRSWSCW